MAKKLAKITEEDWADVVSRVGNTEKKVDGRIDQFSTLLHAAEGRMDELEAKLKAADGGARLRKKKGKANEREGSGDE